METQVRNNRVYLMMILFIIIYLCIYFIIYYFIQLNQKSSLLFYFKKHYCISINVFMYFKSLNPIIVT